MRSDPLAGLAMILDTVPAAEAAALAALATSVVAQAVAIRNAAAPPAEAVQDDQGVEYVPHPLDVLIFAALDQDGAMQQAELLAALGSDTYSSQGRDRSVSAGTLKRRLPELVAAGALVKTAAGYAVRDRDAVDQADATFHG